MNYLHHPNLLVQFWASVNTEFDKIMDKFVRCDGWLFQDMAVVVKKSNIGSIHRCVTALTHSVREGKQERIDHFVRVNFVILDAAKTQWLVPWRNYVVDPSKGVIPPFLKRQVGGFFLLYMLYSNQPLPNRFRRKQRILMDSRDLIAMHVFNSTMQRLPKSDDQFRELARQLVVMFNDLVISEAFEFGCFNDTFITASTSVRNLLQAKFCNFTNTIYKLKDIRDQLHYITYQESPAVFRSLVTYGNLLSQSRDQNGEGDKNVDTSDTQHSVKEEATIFHFKKTEWTVEEISSLEKENDLGKIAHSVPVILKCLDFGPILSRKRLTGIPDSSLDSEIFHCAKVHLSQTNRKNDRKPQIENDRGPSHENKSIEKPSTPTFSAWREYLKGNFDWVEDIICTGNSSVPDKKINLLKTDSVTLGGDDDNEIEEWLEMSDDSDNEEDDDDDDDEEITPDDFDPDLVEVPPSNTNKQAKPEPSPRKKQIR